MHPLADMSTDQSPTPTPTPLPLHIPKAPLFTPTSTSLHSVTPTSTSLHSATPAHLPLPLATPTSLPIISWNPFARPDTSTTSPFVFSGRYTKGLKRSNNPVPDNGRHGHTSSQGPPVSQVDKTHIVEQQEKTRIVEQQNMKTQAIIDSLEQWNVDASTVLDQKTKRIHELEGQVNGYKTQLDQFMARMNELEQKLATQTTHTSQQKSNPPGDTPSVPMDITESTKEPTSTPPSSPPTSESRTDINAITSTSSPPMDDPTSVLPTQLSMDVEAGLDSLTSGSTNLPNLPMPTTFVTQKQKGKQKQVVSFDDDEDMEDSPEDSGNEGDDDSDKSDDEDEDDIPVSYSSVFYRATSKVTFFPFRLNSLPLWARGPFLSRCYIINGLVEVQGHD